MTDIADGEPWNGPHKGVWWLPEDPGRTVPGVLRREPDGHGVLTLEGALVSPSSPYTSIGSVPMIRGKSANGMEAYTLVNCWEAARENIGYNLNGPRSQGFGALYSLIHCAVEAVDPPISAVWARLDVLDEWCQPSEPLEKREDLEPDGTGGYFTNHTLHWRAPISMPSPVGTIDVEFPPGLPDSRVDRVEYRRRAYLNIALDPPLPLSQLFGELLQPIRALIWFATGAELTFTQISPSVIGDDSGLSPVLWCACDPVGVDGERRPMTERQSSDACRHGFFVLNDVEQLSELWDRWFSLHRRVEAPLYAVLGAMDYHSGRHVSDRFQSVAFAAEALHRALGLPAANDLGNGEAKALRHRFRHALLEHQREIEWLHGRIAHIADTPFTARIEALVDRCPPCLQQAVGPDFARRVAHARNSAAHLNDARTVSSGELHRLYNLLILVQSACLMQELGFPEEKINRFVRYSDRYWELIRRRAIVTHGRGETETYEGRVADD